ncbi:MAG TPA: FecR domain-containing protein, partial [Woeseiaceae bacterium]|nr:FecR domain-containing protein [Woeseiaceae bacterium]
MKNAIQGVFLYLLAATATAQDAGTVLFATSGVTAEREPPVALVKGDAVRVQDTVVTDAAARAQLLMVDGAKIALRPGTRLKIEEYSFGTDAGAAASAVTTSGDRSVSSLLKGGFRTITGAIGKQDEKDYEVRTAVGVLGIRGTDYTAVYCNGDCGWAPGISAGQPLEDGLYLGVTEGIIVFRNEFGDIEVRAGQFAFIPLSDRRLQQLATPPAVLLDANDLGLDEAGTAQSRPDDAPVTGFDSKLGTRRTPTPAGYEPADEETSGKGGRDAPEQSVIGVNPDGTPVDITPGNPPPPTNDRTISWATGPVSGIGTLFSGTLINEPTQYELDFNNNVTRFENLHPGRGAAGT